MAGYTNGRITNDIKDEYKGYDRGILLVSDRDIGLGITNQKCVTIYQRVRVSKLNKSGNKWEGVGECVNPYVYMNICIDRE